MDTKWYTKEIRAIRDIVSVTYTQETSHSDIRSDPAANYT